MAAPMPALIQHTYPTPLGDLVALFSPQGLCLLEFGIDTKGLSREWRDVERHAGAAAVPPFRDSVEVTCRSRSTLPGAGIVRISVVPDHRTSALQSRFSP